MTITPAQIRAACGLLGVTQKYLSEMTGITRANLNKHDKGSLRFTTKSMDKITSFFDNNNINFTENGGAEFKPKEEITKLYGKYGFLAFMDEVYNTAKKYGGEICVSNVDERNWIKWMGQDAYDAHAKKMNELSPNYKFKILIEDKDTFFIASEIAEYRYVPKEFFDDQSFYVYGNKLALIAFEENDVRINIINSPGWSKSFRRLFNFAWANISKNKER